MARTIPHTLFKRKMMETAGKLLVPLGLTMIFCAFQGYWRTLGLPMLLGMLAALFAGFVGIAALYFKWQIERLRK